MQKVYLFGNQLGVVLLSDDSFGFFNGLMQRDFPQVVSKTLQLEMPETKIERDVQFCSLACMDEGLYLV